MDHRSVRLLAWTLSPTVAFSSPTVCRIFSNTQPCGLRASGGTAAIRFGAGEAWGAHFAAACHYAEHPETLARFVWDSEPFWVGHAMVDAWVQFACHWKPPY
jgi:hypothetical protein